MRGLRDIPSKAAAVRNKRAAVLSPFLTLSVRAPANINAPIKAVIVPPEYKYVMSA